MPGLLPQDIAKAAVQWGFLFFALAAEANVAGRDLLQHYHPWAVGLLVRPFEPLSESPHHARPAAMSLLRSRRVTVAKVGVAF